MIAALRRHATQHARFYASVAAGAVVFSVTGSLHLPIRLTAAGDAFFIAYLAAMAMLTRRMTLSTMRRRASIEDEGIAIIVLMTLVVIGLSIGSILTVVNQDVAANPFHVALLVANVPLGWCTLHTLAAMHYAHVYYGKAESGDGSRDEGGLVFPGTEEPLVADFLYYAFVIGMTAQVSDVQVQSSVMRRLTLAHGVVSFFFNTVILALAVNVAAGLGR